MNKSEKAAQVLMAARDKIEPKGAWIKGEYAKTKNNAPVSPEDYDAHKFCAIGAIRSVESHGSQVYSEAAYLLCDVMDGNIPEANDSPNTRQKHVLMAFDFAILMAQDEAKALVKKAAKKGNTK